MRKMKRVLSLILAMVMILSLGATPVQAAGRGQQGWSNVTYGADESKAEEAAVPAEETSAEKEAEAPAEDTAAPAEEPAAPAEENEVTAEEPAAPADETEVPAEEPAAPAEPAVSYPAVTLAGATEGGVTVRVEAPEGALPEGAYMTLKDVAAEDVQAKVDGEINGTIIAAVDITFNDDANNEIQPNGNVSVFIKAPEFAESAAEDLGILHIDEENKVAEELTTEENAVEVNAAEGNEISFRNDAFSVYAVFDPSEVIKSTVNFYGLDQTSPVKTFYVKKTEAQDGKTSTIVYDPGIGDTVQNDVHYYFRGWTWEGANYTTSTETKSIDQVQEYIETQTASLTASTTINIYAVIFKEYTITYKDKLGNGDLVGVVGTEKVEVHPSAPYAEYTVNMAYGDTATTHFEGWNVTEGSTYIQGYTDGALYPNGTTININGNIVLSVYAPPGNWLVFDENGYGATYNAPEFVVSGEPTVQPPLATADHMERTGYTFGGWYKDQACTDGNEFVFGEKITTKTTIYAKWIPAGTAPYTVIIWKQNLDGDTNLSTYDYHKSIYVPSGTVAANGNVTASGTPGQNNAYAIVNGGAINASTDSGLTGFHLRQIDNAPIAPEGNTVINVYYDRTEYTLTFQMVNTSRAMHISPTENWSHRDEVDGVQYGWSLLQLLNGNWGTFRIYYNPSDERWYRHRYGTEGNYTYSGYYGANGMFNIPFGNVVNRMYTYGRWKAASTDYDTVATIKALYGQSIIDKFPVNDENGNVFEGFRWDPQNSQTFDYVLVAIGTMPNENITFYGSAPDEVSHLMYYYGRCVDGETGDTTYQGEQYKLLQGPIQADYNYVTYEEDFILIPGYERFESDPPFVNGRAAQYNGTQWTVKFYYKPFEYPITFFDGAEYDGRGSAENPEGNMERVTEGDPLLTYKEIKEEYGSDVSSYNNYTGDSTVNGYVPLEKPGFTFVGWYADKECTQKYTFDKMPLDGITVYAKWVRNAYRVFLHDCNPTNGTIDWGTNQAMDFRVYNGGHVSTPTGTLPKYEMTGWFLDEACTQPFDGGSFELNDTSMEQYGTDYTSSQSDYQASDASRPWITKRLDIYAGWRKVMDGAQGISVIYDNNGGTGNISDANLYKDEAMAVAQAAPQAPSGMQFDHWVIQKWNESAGENGAFEDTDKIVLPGKNFQVIGDDAHQVVHAYGPDNVTVTDADYYFQLRAEYVPATVPTRTQIKWYKNYGTGTDPLKTDELDYNEPVVIPDAPTRAAYTFLGWAKDAESIGAITTKTKADLFLKYDDGQYQAMKNGDWADVEKVAQDTINPGEALYAIWEKTPIYYYVFHSHNATLTAYELYDDDGNLNTYDFANVADGYLYGGCYKSYGGVTAENIAAAKVSAVESLGVEVPVGDAQTYDGSSMLIETEAKLKPRFWKNNQWYTNTPVLTENTVYYVKEVPDEYLTNYTAYIYNKDAEDVNYKKITTLYLTSAVDDTYYRGVYFKVTAGNSTYSATLCTTFKIVDRDGTTTAVDPGKFGLTRAYIAYAGVTDTGFLGTTEIISITPYWVTKDGVRVEGPTRVINMGDGSINEGTGITLVTP